MEPKDTITEIKTLAGGKIILIRRGKWDIKEP